MPNHCEHDFYIEGKKEDVAEILEAIKGTKENQFLDFNRLIPYPENLALMDKIHQEAGGYFADTAEYRKKLVSLLKEHNLDIDPDKFKDGFNSGGHGWCTSNWGTKWNAYNFEPIDDWQVEEHSEVSFKFETAWSPPEPIIHKIAELTKEKEVSIRITYFERGMAFHGFYRLENGEVSDHEQAKYYGNRGG